MRVRRAPTALNFVRSRGDDPGESFPEPPPGSPLPPPPIEPIPPAEDPAPPQAPPPPYILPSGASLAKNQRLTSISGRAVLIHQEDGNVVIYVDGEPRWSTNTYGAPTYLFTMEPGGNLVLYKADGASFWNSGTAGYAGAYLALSDDGGAAIISRAGDAVWRAQLSPPPSTPAPPRTPRDLTQEAIERIKASTTLVRLAVGMPPMSNVNDLLAWSRAVRDLRAINPLINEAFNVIQAAYPQEEEPQGFFAAVADFGSNIVEGVAFVGGKFVNVVGSVIKFVAGDLPSPDDYLPENLCVTGWTNPAKMALLTGVAALIFPPALLYIGLYIPPNIAGLPIGMAQALAVGGPDRVIAKILNPLWEALYGKVKEVITVVLDFAFNGNAALVRWALRKIAEKLPEGVHQAIILALAEAGDTLLDALKSLQAIKTESFYVSIGDALEKVAGQLNAELQAYIAAIGSAIKAGAAAISLIIDKGLEGVDEAGNILITRLLGIPDDFMALSRAAQIEIAKIKVFGGDAAPTAMLAAVVQGVREGLSDLVEATQKLPFDLAEIVGGVVGLVDQLVGNVDGFIQQLFALAAEGGGVPDAGGPEGDLPSPDGAPGGPAPSGGSGGMSKILFAGAGGLLGTLLGGPIGGVAGAGAGLLLGKGK
jgi:hypothetical protein